MKIQQRSFVVEIKSARRRSKTQPKSIWGNTDFAALVRDSEATLPFMHNAKSETPVNRKDIPHELKTQIELTDLSMVAEGLRVMPFVQSDSIEQHQLNAVSTEGEALKVVASKPKRRTAEAIEHLRTRRGCITEDVSALLPVVTAIGLVETYSDELASLDAENLRLKQMLADYLGQQNAQLRTMLKRFEIA